MVVRWHGGMSRKCIRPTWVSTTAICLLG
jgi:hypothetical protein